MEKKLDNAHIPEKVQVRLTIQLNNNFIRNTSYFCKW